VQSQDFRRLAADTLGERGVGLRELRAKPRIVERQQIDVGLAVETEGMGLVVPVLRDVMSKGLKQLNDEWKDLVARARIKRLKPQEYSNPTFTISNMGRLGVTNFDAIPSPGTSAIFVGGGVPKDFIQITATSVCAIRGSAEACPHVAAIQLTTDNTVFGGLGGASVATCTRRPSR